MKGPIYGFATGNINIRTLQISKDNLKLAPWPYYYNNPPKDDTDNNEPWVQVTPKSTVVCKKHYRLSDAVADAHKVSPSFPLKVIAFEKVQNGTREYLACSMETLLQNLKKPLMYIHEVWLPTALCRLAFDIDFKLLKDFSIEEKKIILDRMRDFIWLLYACTNKRLESMGIISGDKKLEMLSLSCHRDNYFSFHVIMHIDGSRFYSTVDMGIFAMCIGQEANAQLKALPDTIKINGLDDIITTPAIMPDDSTRTHNLPKTINLDNIYMPNRCFRTLYSSKKANKNHKLIVDQTVSTLKLPFQSYTKEDLFRLSLVQYIGVKEKISKTVICEHLKLGIGYGKYKSTSSKSKLIAADSPEEETMNMILNLIIDKYGDNKTTGIGYYPRRKTLLIFTRTMFCETRGRNHFSNRVLYVVELGYAKNFKQTCRDDDCILARKKRPNHRHIIPEPMWSRIKDLVAKMPKYESNNEPNQPNQSNEPDDLIIDNGSSTIFGAIKNMTNGGFENETTDNSSEPVDPITKMIEDQINNSIFLTQLNNENFDIDEPFL